MLIYITALTFFILGYGVGYQIRIEKLKKNLTKGIEKFKKPQGKVFSPSKKKKEEDLFAL